MADLSIPTPDPAIPGVFLTSEFAAMAWDEDRDQFTREQRVAAWHNLNAQHMLRRHEKRPYSYCNFMISGDKGVGKTALAAMLAMLNYAQGMEVFSTASLLFGHRIDAMDVFTMAESLPANCTVFVDEAHSVADRYSENATRNRTLASSIALLRKNGVRLIFASVHEHAVAMSIKSELDTLIYPALYSPKELNYPPWCYVKTHLIGPQPFRGRREADNWEIRRFGGDVKKRTIFMPPHLLFEAAKVMDTFAKPDIAAGIMTSAADVRQRLEQREEEVDAEVWQRKQNVLLQQLIPVIRSGWYPEKRVHWRAIYGEMIKQSQTALREKEVHELCRMFFGADQSGHVKPEAIFKNFSLQTPADDGTTI